MAAGFVQGNSQVDFGVTSVSVTLTGVAAGNTLAVFVGWIGTTQTLASVTGGSFTLQDNPTDVSTFGRVAQGYAANVAGGNTTVTANFSGAVTGSLHAIELSGVPTGLPQDDHKVNVQVNPGTGTDATTSTPATVSAGGILLGASFDLSNTSAPNAGTGFTSVSSVSAGRSEYQLIASSGTQAATFTETESTGANGTLAMSFQSAAPPPAQIVSVMTPLRW